MTNASNVKRGFTPDSNPKRGNIKIGNNIDINLCKSAKAKKQCHSLRYSVLIVRNDQCKHFKCGFTFDSNPKGEKGGNEIGIYLCKRNNVIITDIASLLSFRECGLTNASILSVALPLSATPKGVTKGGNKMDMYLCKSRNVKTIVMSYLSVPEYGMTNGRNLRDAFTSDSTPKRGKRR